MNPKWLEWARRLQALAQNGLAYAQTPFDRERYEAVRQVAEEIMSGHSSLDLGQVRALFAVDSGYATPKVDVRAAVFKNDRILLVKERVDGKWTLPGGWADVNEPPSEAIEREVLEEAGYRAKAVKLLAVYDREKHGHSPPHPYHVYKLFFLCELLGGAPTTSIETDGVDFYPENGIPELSVARTTAKQIARFFEHHRHPDWPTDFD
jgi:ADP-ribose pyrophosphatase YjhB (NUDIX family)